MAFKKEKVILGLGLIEIDDVAFGYTRGGGNFTVERTYHAIKADGDKGYHEDSIILDEERAKLQFSTIELIDSNMLILFPGLKSTAGKVEPTGLVTSTDYRKVSWVGKTKGGKSVKITLNKAINLENINWGLVEKDEVVQSATYEATYEEGVDINAYTAPYSITFSQ